MLTVIWLSLVLGFIFLGYDLREIRTRCETSNAFWLPNRVSGGDEKWGRDSAARGDVRGALTIVLIATAVGPACLNVELFSTYRVIRDHRTAQPRGFSAGSVL